MKAIWKHALEIFYAARQRALERQCQQAVMLERGVEHVDLVRKTIAMHVYGSSQHQESTTRAVGTIAAACVYLALQYHAQVYSLPFSSQYRIVHEDMGACMDPKSHAARRRVVMRHVKQIQRAMHQKSAGVVDWERRCAFLLDKDSTSLSETLSIHQRHFDERALLLWSPKTTDHPHASASEEMTTIPTLTLPSYPAESPIC